MWMRVTAGDEEVLQAYTAVLRTLEPLQRMYSFGSLLAQTRSSVAHERVFLFHYPGDGFNLFLRIQHEERLARYLICPALEGAIEPSAALDLMIDKASEFARQRGTDRLYAIEPKGVDASPLAELFRTLREHAGVAVKVDANLADCTVLKFGVPTPVAGVPST